MRRFMGFSHPSVSTLLLVDKGTSPVGRHRAADVSHEYFGLLFSHKYYSSVWTTTCQTDATTERFSVTLPLVNRPLLDVISECHELSQLPRTSIKITKATIAWDVCGTLAVATRQGRQARPRGFNIAANCTCYLRRGAPRVRTAPVLLAPPNMDGAGTAGSSADAAASPQPDAEDAPDGLGLLDDEMLDEMLEFERIGLIDGGDDAVANLEDEKRARRAAELEEIINLLDVAVEPGELDGALPEAAHGASLDACDATAAFTAAAADDEAERVRAEALASSMDPSDLTTAMIQLATEDPRYAVDLGDLASDAAMCQGAVPVSYGPDNPAPRILKKTKFAFLDEELTTSVLDRWASEAARSFDAFRYAEGAILLGLKTSLTWKSISLVVTREDGDPYLQWIHWDSAVTMEGRILDIGSLGVIPYVQPTKKRSFVADVESGRVAFLLRESGGRSLPIASHSYVFPTF